jgi:lysophospholipase L1-like esterase
LSCKTKTKLDRPSGDVPNSALFLLALTMILTQPHISRADASFEDFDRRANTGEPMSVVFFGGSLTWGANSSDPQSTSYRALMGQYLRSKYPKTSFTFHDAAIGGTGSKLGMFRLDRDVLSQKPDLVFLDFTANDDLFSDDLPTLSSYECLLREMIGRHIPIVQVFMGFKFTFGPNWNPDKLLRVIAHKKLAAAYHTGVGDVFPFVEQKLASGQAKIEKLWPFDGAHPDDPGYELFFEAVRDGFEQALTEKRVCVVPDKPVFSDQYMTRTRLRLADAQLPAGWRVSKTYRTSLWFDGLSSRWMGDVALCDMKDKATIQTLTIPFAGTFVGIIGEADGDGLSFKASVDGQPLLYRENAKAEPTDVWPFDTKRLGVGRLFVWRELSDTLSAGKHALVLQPVFIDGHEKVQLRIESVCVAGN